MTEILANKYRNLTIQGIFSNDDLMEILTLKGGNAMQLLEITDRASQDLDFSIRQGIKLSAEVEGVAFKESLDRIFEEEGLKVIDYKFVCKPKKSKSVLPPFWGGYGIEFKLITNEFYEKYGPENPQALSVRAESLEGGKKKIEIDISLEEYTEPRIEMELEDITIYLYSPLMIIYEKMRALCQQLPDYPLASTEKVRARDLYDIYIAITKSKGSLLEEIYNEKNLYIIKEMFKTKDVDIGLLRKIKDYKDNLEQDYKDRVIPQISEKSEKPNFEYLFSYNLKIINEMYELISK